MQEHKPQPKLSDRLIKANKVIDDYVIKPGDDEITIFNKKSRYKRHKQGLNRADRRLAKKQEKAKLAKQKIASKEESDKEYNILSGINKYKKGLLSGKLLFPKSFVNSDIVNSNLVKEELK